MSRRLCVRILTLVTVALASAALGARPAASWLREEVERILAQPQYRQPDPTLLMRLLERIAKWLDVLGWQRFVFGLHKSAPVLYWAIVGLLVAVLALLLYHIFITIKLALARAEPRRRPTRAAPTVSPVALRRRARELAAQGRFAEALEALHRAIVVLLDRRDMLRDDPSLTNWERARALAARPALAREFEALAGRLDVLWYGGRPVDEAQWQSCAEAVDRAWSLAEAGQ